MNSFAMSSVIVPGAVALLLFLLFTYLYEQSRQQYFRAWQFAWAFYTLHYGLDAWDASPYHKPIATISYLGSLLLVAMTLCIYVSTRLMREKFRIRWDDVTLAVAGMLLAWWNVRAQMADGAFGPPASLAPRMPLDVGMGIVLLYCSFYFYRHAHRKNSLAFTLLAVALALWAVLMIFGKLSNPFVAMFGAAGHIL